MPAKGHVKADRLTHREKVSVTPALSAKLAEKAKACGMTKSRFMRHVLEVAVGERDDRPRARRNVRSDNLSHEVHNLAMHIKKLGTNINQLARQANQGMVPITEAEARYMKNQHQMVLSAAVAFFERVGG